MCFGTGSRRRFRRSGRVCEFARTEWRDLPGGRGSRLSGIADGPGRRRGADARADAGLRRQHPLRHRRDAGVGDRDVVGRRVGVCQGRLLEHSHRYVSRGGHDFRRHRRSDAGVSRAYIGARDRAGGRVADFRLPLDASAPRSTGRARGRPDRGEAHTPGPTYLKSLL